MIEIPSQIGHRRQVVNPKYANFGSREYTRLSDSVRRVCYLKSTPTPPKPSFQLEKKLYQLHAEQIDNIQPIFTLDWLGRN